METIVCTAIQEYLSKLRTSQYRYMNKTFPKQILLHTLYMQLNVREACCDYIKALYIKATLPPLTMFNLSFIIPRLKGDPFLRYNYKPHSWCHPEGGTIKQIQLVEQM